MKSFLDVGALHHVFSSGRVFRFGGVACLAQKALCVLDHFGSVLALLTVVGIVVELLLCEFVDFEY